MVQEYFRSNEMNKLQMLPTNSDLYYKNLMENDSTANKTLHVTFVWYFCFGIEIEGKIEKPLPCLQSSNMRLYEKSISSLSFHHHFSINKYTYLFVLKNILPRLFIFGRCNNNNSNFNNFNQTTIKS